MQKRTNQVYLALGSNLGDRRANLKHALEELSSKIKNMVTSPIYETEPWGVKEQPMFLNICIGGVTSLSPKALLKFINGIEQRLRKNVQIKWGPTEVDVDIIFYNQQIVHSPELVIPQLHLAERAFVLVPLADIAPDFVHPELKYNVKQMLLGVDTSTIRAYQEN